MSLITPELRARFDILVAYYPPDQRQAAVIPLLHLMQEKGGQGFLTAEAQAAVADYLGVPVVKVQEVVSFYTMLSEKKRGKNHLMVCHTLPCELTGCEGVMASVNKRLGLKGGEVSPDGKFSVEEVECLARCGEGPVMQVGERVFTHLTPESVLKAIDDMEKVS
ncbi:MAG: NAD(P)H-dependent oxidoreductase subunit E [candidate division FCPU426 bacterium]